MQKSQLFWGGGTPRVYILGGAQTDFERNWTKEGKGVIALLREVLTDALTNVNMRRIEIGKPNCLFCRKLHCGEIH